MLADVGLVQCTENTSAYKHQSDNVQESSHNILFNDLIHVESSHVQNLQIISQKTAVMRAKTSNRGGNEDFINIKNIPDVGLDYSDYCVTPTFTSSPCTT